MLLISYALIDENCISFRDRLNCNKTANCYCITAREWGGEFIMFLSSVPTITTRQKMVNITLIWGNEHFGK